jgi:hypothetical protein
VQNTRRVRASFVLVAALAIASCGGGGGGGGSPPPPPPPPPPPASVVVARAVASAASVQEGQPFSVDASTSTTTNAAPLAYTWTQVSGPAITITNSTAAKIDLTAPEVTADAAAQFRVTATSGADTASATVDVTFANIAQTPVFASSTMLGTASFNLPVTKIIGDQTETLVGVPFGGPSNTSFIGLTLAGNALQVGNSTAGNFPPLTVFKPPALSVANDPAVFKFAAASESQNTLSLFRRPPGGPSFSSVFLNMAIDRPCGMSFSWSIEGSQGIYVGQRNKGFSLVKINSDPSSPFTFPSTLLSVGATESLCTLLAPSGPVVDGPSGPIFKTSSRLEDVLAIDASTNTIHHFAPPSNIALSYTLKEQVPVQLNSTKPLTLAAWVEVGPYAFPMGMALLFTDGAHNGEHRLVIVGLDGDRKLVQETHSWTMGVPSDVIYDDLNGDNVREVIVISSTSPQAMVFEHLGPTVVPLSAPKYLEVGLGATAALPSWRSLLGAKSLTVAYRDKKQVRAIGVGP